MENSEKTFLNCPKCGAEVRYINLGGIGYEECPNCQGIFLDFHETDNEIVADVLSVSSEIRKDQKSLDEITIHCPKCKVEMEKRAITKRKDMSIDTCPECKGAWFDQGEFQKYLNPVESLVMSPSPFKIWFECEACQIFRNQNEVKERESGSPLCPRCQKPLQYKCVRVEESKRFRKDMPAIIAWGSCIIISFDLIFIVLRSVLAACFFTLLLFVLIWMLLNIANRYKEENPE